MSHRRLITLLTVAAVSTVVACGSDRTSTEPGGTPLFLTNGPDSATRPFDRPDQHVERRIAARLDPAH